MDYEKKYKEALERARKFAIDDAYASQGVVAKLIFPELRESEDERIRKGLIAMLSQDKELHRREIAYLEKQKVPEGLHPEEYPLTPDECVKPVEWSEKDKEMLMRCIAAIPVQGNEIMPTSYLNKLRNWLEFLPERFNLPPKQEWSEEDEKLLNYAISMTDDAQVERFLKSLRPPKDCSNDCPKHLQGYIDGRGDAEKKLLDEYGILIMPEGELHMKARWKPSEEQIEALNYAIAEWDGGKRLESLYALRNDLKKLK